jgi:hypothetical protein
MKIMIITDLVLLLPAFGFTQGEWNNWYFGWHAGMTFNSGSPVALPTSVFTQSACLITTCVSDSAGNFLFYSNGLRVSPSLGMNCDFCS